MKNGKWIQGEETRIRKALYADKTRSSIVWRAWWRLYDYLFATDSVKGTNYVMVLLQVYFPEQSKPPAGYRIGMETFVSERTQARYRKEFLEYYHFFHKYETGELKRANF